MNKKKEIIMWQTYEFSFCYNLLHYWYLISRVSNFSIVFRDSGKIAKLKTRKQKSPRNLIAM